MQAIKEIEKAIQENKAVMFYFWAPSCSICHSLKPKLLKSINEEFDKFKIIEIDVSAEQETAGQFNIFALPTIIIFLDGKELFRRSRNMGVGEVIRSIKRPYEIMMS